MFYRQASNQYIQENTNFEVQRTQYSASWLNNATPEQKAALGLVEVTDANRPEDDRFYWVTSALNGAVRTYTNTPKDLDALKKTWAASARQTAYSLLAPSDWMVTREIENQTAVPDAWKTYRAAVRTTCAAAITSINSAADIPALQAAIQIVWPTDPDHPDLASL